MSGRTGLRYPIALLCLFSCSDQKPKEPPYRSRNLNSYRLLPVDTMIFQQPSDKFIGQIWGAKVWQDRILISDVIGRCVWVFDQALSPIKVIGRKGSGPEEFKSAPIIVTDSQYLWLFDIALKRVSRYDEELNYQCQFFLPKERSFDPKGIKVESGFVFSGGYDRALNNDDDLRACPPLVLLDSTLRFQGLFGEWDDIYFDKEMDAYARNQADAELCSDSHGGFFLHQQASPWILQYDARNRLQRKFGGRPLFWRAPPKVTFRSTQVSLEALSSFIGSSTTFWGIHYDEVNDRLILNYANLEKDYFMQRTLTAGRHYVQVFNAEHDCIFDGEIPGRLAFVHQGKIYVLTDERPEFIKFSVFRLAPK